MEVERIVVEVVVTEVGVGVASCLTCILGALSTGGGGGGGGGGEENLGDDSDDDGDGDDGGDDSNDDDDDDGGDGTKKISKPVHHNYLPKALTTKKVSSPLVKLQLKSF
ncbi:hypothetical protein Pmani_017902 [Petrolisthes manimaculis]|uniref:Uncharacterized protein n=1 Tax=Petrolisthes manimaculis TaxID=1843537 RepID=A0AAE1PKW6_9EUCA|nr:hypothetical protein Pmani_017902 [Petrolisthes manimaculis]